MRLISFAGLTPADRGCVLQLQARAAQHLRIMLRWFQILKPRKAERPRLGRRTRYRLWKADLAARHWWFRILLHSYGIVRRPRNFRWHWPHIVHEFHDRKPRP